MTPLHHFGNFVRDLFLSIPLGGARLLFIALPIVLLIWVLSLPREETTPEQGKGSWDENLKLGATIALVLQVLIYSFL